ncbi:polyphosphate kinase 2 [Nitratireductor soli]|uniref:polyphosphate kinase 2 n=1 Tax=Nitratireductor soli TaxID=1670619 RepID=UPI00065DD69C|nr:polyphosphate kinase 2 [Nitratireductor soli]
MNKPLENPVSLKTEPIKLKISGKKRTFDIDDPDLPKWVKEHSLSAGGFPYEEEFDNKEYEQQLEAMQIELVKLQGWMQSSGARVMALFEGRDAAGKGGTISRIRAYMNPRTARNVALPKPSETERGQWYFQRYVTHFPTSGEFITFDRSWYNRGGVEPVMGFCTPSQHEQFLDEAPDFERAIVNDGIHLFKFWLNIGQETQLERFHDRRHSKLKYWKFSPMDVAGIRKWDDYTRMRDLMLERTHSPHAPWTVVRANDKRRARLAVIRRILLSIAYDGRDLDAIGAEDPKIIGSGAGFLA